MRKSAKLHHSHLILLQTVAALSSRFSAVLHFRSFFLSLTTSSSRAQLRTTYAGGASSCRCLILFHLSNLFQFHSALLPTYPFGNTSSSKKKNKKKIHIRYPSVPTILPWDWPEGPVSHIKEPVSRWGETRRRAAGSRRSLTASCEGGGRNPSTAGERRTCPPCGRQDSGG